jgi:hypothetical protein
LLTIYIKYNSFKAFLITINIFPINLLPKTFRK